jgi:hypothetical protein
MTDDAMLPILQNIQSRLADLDRKVTTLDRKVTAQGRDLKVVMQDVRMIRATIHDIGLEIGVEELEITKRTEPHTPPPGAKHRM